MTTPDERRFGRDVYLPLTPDEPLHLTPSGDLATLAGRPNAVHALQRATLIQPGQLLHRPTYGGGLPALLERPATPARRADAQNALRRALRDDPRVTDARVTVSPGLPDGTARATAVTASASVRLAGDTVDTPLTVTAE